MELEDEIIAIEAVGVNAQAVVPLLVGNPLLDANHSAGESTFSLSELKQNEASRNYLTRKRYLPTGSLIPSSVSWKTTSASGCDGLSTIFATLVFFEPLRK